MIKQPNILIFSGSVQKTAGHSSQSDKPQLLIKMNRSGIRSHNCIELQHTKAQLPSFLEGMAHQRFADMQAAPPFFYGIAGIGEMAAAADVVGMEDIEANDGSLCHGYSAEALGSKEGLWHPQGRAARFGERRFLPPQPGSRFPAWREDLL